MASGAAVFNASADPVTRGDGIDQVSAKPDATVLVYPLTDPSSYGGFTDPARSQAVWGATPPDPALYATARYVTAETGPTFITHSTKDTGVTAVDHGDPYFAACEAAGVLPDIEVTLHEIDKPALDKLVGITTHERLDTTLFEKASKEAKKRSGGGGSSAADGDGDGGKGKQETLYYKVMVRDNGCGMPHNTIPDSLGRVLAGSKYGVRQTRGKFGLGAKMALIWSKQSTGLPVEVRSATGPDKLLSVCVLDIDIRQNEPKTKLFEQARTCALPALRMRASLRSATPTPSVLPASSTPSALSAPSAPCTSSAPPPPSPHSPRPPRSPPPPPPRRCPTPAACRAPRSPSSWAATGPSTARTSCGTCGRSP